MYRVFRGLWHGYPDFLVPTVQIPDIVNAGPENLAGVVVIGILCGLVGPLFTWVAAKNVLLRKLVQERLKKFP